MQPPRTLQVGPVLHLREPARLSSVPGRHGQAERRVLSRQVSAGIEPWECEQAVQLPPRIWVKQMHMLYCLVTSISACFAKVKVKHLLTYHLLQNWEVNDVSWKSGCTVSPGAPAAKIFTLPRIVAPSFRHVRYFKFSWWKSNGSLLPLLWAFVPLSTVQIAIYSFVYTKFCLFWNGGTSEVSVL